MADPINWAALMRHGMGALHLSPDAFWDMTPAELRLAMEGAGLLSSDAPMGRDWLATLMEAHPDQPGSRTPVYGQSQEHKRGCDGQ